MRMVGIMNRVKTRFPSVMVAFSFSLVAVMASANSAPEDLGIRPVADRAVLSGAKGAEAADRMAEDTGLKAMSDTEMSDVSGQALFQTQKIAGDATGNDNLDNNLDFYRAGLDAELDLNMNIENLELGRTGPDNWPDSSPFDPNSADNYYDDYDPNVDFWAKNVAFGCTADGPTMSASCVDSGSATDLKPLRLLRPYLEFAIENEDTVTQREVVGIRLGAENVRGPLSFGQVRSFSGYLSAQANLTMEGMTDVAATCGPANPPCPGSIGGGADGQGRNVFGLNAPQNSLGLDNADVCSGALCAEMADLTVDFDSASANGLNVLANQSRVKSANVLQPGLATLIDDAVSTLETNRCEANDVVCFGAGLIPDLVRPAAADEFKSQVCAGLNINPCSDSNLNSTPLPYNLTNFHQVEVNASNIGLSFQKRDLRYPGYLGQVQQGWGLHLPDAFTLNVSRPAAVFTRNIANGSAGRGDLVSLDPPFDNCWGQAEFC